MLRIDIHPDSLKNGATIGAIVMGGLTAIGCGAVQRGRLGATALVFNTAFGGLIGAGIDAWNGGRTTIYSKPAPAAQPGGPRPRASVQFRVRF